MKKYCMTGLIILLPFTLSALIFSWLIEILTAPFMPLAKEILSHTEFSHHKVPLLLIFTSRILVILSLFIITFLVGFLANKFIISHFIAFANRLFLYIPGLRSIYCFCQNITKATFSTSKPPFNGSVLISFPQKDSVALGLVTGPIPDPLKNHIKELDVAVFVPTAPHPISGFILMTSKKCICPVDMTTEEVFKFIISCGIIPPEHHHTTQNSHD